MIVHPFNDLNVKIMVLPLEYAHTLFRLLSGEISFREVKAEKLVQASSSQANLYYHDNQYDS